MSTGSPSPTTPCRPVASIARAATRDLAPGARHEAVGRRAEVRELLRAVELQVARRLVDLVLDGVGGHELDEDVDDVGRVGRRPGCRARDAPGAATGAACASGDDAGVLPAPDVVPGAAELEQHLLGLRAGVLRRAAHLGRLAGELDGVGAHAAPARRPSATTSR